MRIFFPLKRDLRRNQALGIGTMNSMTDKSKKRHASIPTESIPWDSSWPKLAEEGDRDQVLTYLEQRFGISTVLFEDFLLFRKKKSWWLLKKSPHITGASQLKVVMTGLRAFQRVGRFLKPTTRFMQIFGYYASRAVIHLNDVHLTTLKEGETLQGDMALENGYVILSFQKHILGLGLQVDGRIHSQIPRRDIASLNT